MKDKDSHSLSTLYESVQQASTPNQFVKRALSALEKDGWKTQMITGTEGRATKIDESGSHENVKYFMFVYFWPEKNTLQFYGSATMPWGDIVYVKVGNNQDEIGVSVTDDIEHVALGVADEILAADLPEEVPVPTGSDID